VLLLLWLCLDALLALNLAIAIFARAISVVEIVRAISMREGHDLMPVVADRSSRLSESSKDLASADRVFVFDCAVHRVLPVSESGLILAQIRPSERYEIVKVVTLGHEFAGF
jgi:hypothetical protein